MTIKNDYSAQSIKVIEGLEAVRKRPAMYIGSTGLQGLNHLVYEVVDNSVDEALAGYCSEITVILKSDGSCSIEDNGRGIPIDIHPTEKKSAAEVVMTKLHAGGKFDKESYKFSGGLHGVGISVVNALSSKLDLEIYKNGIIYAQSYERGKPLSPLKQEGKTHKRGTFIQFTPDPEIFTETTKFSFDTLSTRLRELAFLNKGLKIIITDETNQKSHKFFFEGGIKSFIEHINSKKNPLFPEIIYFNKEDKKYILEAALQYNDSYTEQLFSFVNNINTMEGGTHVAGFKSALTKACNKAAQKLNILKGGESLSSEDVREGLVAVINLKAPEPQFEGQTKTKLGNSEVKGIVDSWTFSALDTFFEEHPPITKKILQKAENAKRAREAARKARDIARRKTALESTILPGKLADCANENPANTELFIVEGDSAGGCFAGETKLSLADGRNLSLKELIEEEKRGIKNYCYTANKNGEIETRLITHPRKTKSNAEVIKVILDNNEEIICTPDHKFMLQNGSYKEAISLKPSDNLMSLNDLSKIKKIEKLNHKIDVYDIEVEKTHNFALNSGIFVHNSAKQARDRYIQAILPLRGKILNVEKARLDKILSNEEIKSLITAIGGGAIGEDFNADKVRYHKIILMTDADVDGAHIRTLLLTFFFRYMKPLIEHGYLYIAQPPLYKVKIGKKEAYLKDENSFQRFLFDWAKNQISFIIKEEVLPENEWHNLLNNILEYSEQLEQVSMHFKLTNQACNHLVNFLYTHPWKNKENYNELLENLTKYFTEYKIYTEENKEEDNIIKKYVNFKKLNQEWNVAIDFFSSPEIEKLLNKFKLIELASNQEWKMQIKGKDKNIKNKGIINFINSITKLSKSYINIQRYKGLGEMNPEQLWETSMSPNTRSLLRVKMEDALEADKWFTNLMGEQVAGRKDYIEEYGRFVKNLDI